MKETMICLGGGVEAVPIIQKVKDMGLNALVLDYSPSAPGLFIADEAFSAVSCYHPESALPALSKRGRRYAGVLCCAVDAPITAAVIAEEFALAGIPPDAAILSEDKFEQKKKLMAAGIPVPPFGLNHPEGYGVVKPRDGRGGRGVIRLLPGVDLDWAYNTASKNGKKSKDVICEKWLDGPQLSTESIVQGGQVLFTAVALRNYARLDEFAPYVIEDGSDSPWPDGFVLGEYIGAACRVLGWDNCTVKGDLVISEGKAYIIELAARLSGGFFCSHITPMAYGVDFVKAAIQIALGEKADAGKARDGAFVSQRYIFPSKEDIGKTVKRVGDTGTSPFSTYNIKAGDIIQPVDCHPRRWGQVICAGNTLDAAREVAQIFVNLLKNGVTVE